MTADAPTLGPLAGGPVEAGPRARHQRGGIFISCGGRLTLDAIRQLEDELGLPVTPSSPAGLRDIVQLGGADPRSDGFGRLFALA